jgi:hypothetical protein
MTHARKAISMATMSGTDRHCCTLPPTIRRPAGGVWICPGLVRIWAALLALALLVNLLPMSSAVDLGHTSPLSVAVASSSGDDPCRPGDACGHDRIHCCLSASAAISGPADAALDLSPRPSARPRVGSDVNHGSADPLSPFHPPKLLASA